MFMISNVVIIVVLTLHIENESYKREGKQHEKYKL